MQHLFNNRIDIQRKYEVPDGMGGFKDKWANLERLNVSSIVGTFVKHEVVTGGTSGATAKIGTVGSDHLEIYERSDADFEAEEEITGATSKATADIDSIKGLASVPCRLQPYSGRELFTAGKTTVFASHRLFMAVPAVTITEADRIRFGSRDFGISLIKNWNEAGFYYRLDLLEIK